MLRLQLLMEELSTNAPILEYLHLLLSLLLKLFWLNQLESQLLSSSKEPVKDTDQVIAERPDSNSLLLLKELLTVSHIT